jgi:acyl carrier protein
VEEVAAAHSLKDLDVDSLGLIDIIFEMEKRLQLQVPDHLLKGVASLDDLVRVIDTVRAQAGGTDAGTPAHA